MAASLRKVTAGATAPNINTTAQIVDTPTESTSSICHLLGLPAELRLEIYEIIIASTPRPSTTNKTLEPSIMSTCHQIRAETLESFVSQLEIWDQEVFAEIDELQKEDDRLVATNLNWREVYFQHEKFHESREAYIEVVLSMQKKYRSLVPVF